MTSTTTSTLDHKVFFGAYTLEHWMKLLRNRNIILPEYQRHFVWDKERVMKLAASIGENLFVPPVTIGAFWNGTRYINYIIDGQQRLTSILLSRMGVFPIKEKFKKTVKDITVEEGNREGKMSTEDNMIIQWTVNNLLEDDNTFEAIQERAKKSQKYEIFQPLLSEKEIKDRTLGFNFLIPNTKAPKEMQRYFSSVFRNVNYNGVNLLPQESRKALYFLDTTYTLYFEPDFCERIRVGNKIQGTASLDFTRMLAFLTDYHNNQSFDTIAKGFQQDLESYYEMFIQSVVNNEYEERFGKFGVIFPNNEFNSDMEKLKQHLETLDLLRSYESIIDLDVYFIGLIYNVLFLKKAIDSTKMNEMNQELQEATDKFKSEKNHSKDPSKLAYLRNRVQKSIEIYKKYVL